jgi:hypothetical protein
MDGWVVAFIYAMIYLQKVNGSCNYIIKGLMDYIVFLY